MRPTVRRHVPAEGPGSGFPNRPPTVLAQHLSYTGVSGNYLVGGRSPRILTAWAGKRTMTGVTFL